MYRACADSGSTGHKNVLNIVSLSHCLEQFYSCFFNSYVKACLKGAQWLSGRVLDSRPKGRGFEPHQRHCVVSLSKNINPSLVLVQPRKTRPFITERLLMGRKESNPMNKCMSKYLVEIHVWLKTFFLFTSCRLVY